MTGPRRVLLIEDETLVRSALRLLFETVFGFEVQEARGCDQALATDLPGIDLALLDLHLPGVGGVATLRRLREARADLPVLILSSYSSDEEVRDALDAGANGYILKGATSEHLGEAISVALSGEGIYLDPQVAAIALKRTAPRPAPLMTEREMEVLARVVRGETNEHIGNALYISLKTVKAHVSAIFRKLGVSTRAQAAAVAVARGLVSVEETPGRPGTIGPRT